MKIQRIVTALVLLVASGCATHNQTKLGGGSVEAVTTTASHGLIDVEGNQSASYQGLAPTLIKQDSEGNWVNMGGPTGIMSAPVPGTNQLAYIISQANTSIARVQYTPEPAAGEAQILIEGIEVNMSDPMSQHVAALQVALPVLADMTKAEALARVEQWRITGEIAESMAPLLVQMINLFLK